MKNVKESLLERRSVRRYERKKLEANQLDLIYQAIRNTPTSFNGQQFSVISIEDQTRKEQIYALTGEKQIKTCATFLVFCVDYHKLRVAGALKGVQTPPFESTIDGYTVGVIDASLAMMSAVVAAESMGLGCCCIGQTRSADPDTLSQMLQLPQGVSIVCGLAIGVANEHPDLKPKLPLETVIHAETYTSDAQLQPQLAAYDAQVIHYNQTRSGGQSDNDWATHIAAYHTHSMEHSIDDYLRTQLKLNR